MKHINIFLSFILLASCLSSCWKENIPQAGESRPQVVNLKAVAGDEEVELSWEAAQGTSPSDYIITYTDTDANSVEYRTGGATSHLLSGLVNGNKYSFNLQAVYGAVISGMVSVDATPATSRFAVADLTADSSDGFVTLLWTRPSTSVLSYTLTYYCDADASDVRTVQIDKDAQSFDVTGLTNDLNYYFTLVAVYKKGASEPVSVKAMPSTVIPYFVSTTCAAIGQKIVFTFNSEGYPGATDIKWTFPGGDVLNGKEVEYRLFSEGTQTVILSASVNGREKNWKIELQIREFAVNYLEWQGDGSTYNGFKGSCPVFSPDGKTVYDITFNKVSSLYAFDVISGELKWAFSPESKASSYNMLTVNPVTGAIYYGTTTAGQFYAVSPSGQLLWTFTETGSMQSAAPAVSRDGSKLFLGDKLGNVFALNTNDGSKIWGPVSLGSNAVAALLVNGDELVAGSNAKTVHFLKVSDGSVSATLTLSQTMTDISGFAVASDGRTVYVPQTAGYISSIDIVSKSIKVNGFNVGSNNNYEPVVAPNGSVFFGSKDGSAYCVSADLTSVLWSVACPNGGNSFNYSHPCVDTENRFYITAGQKQNINYIIDSAGNVVEQWSYGTSANQKQMGGNNYLDGIFYSAMVGAANDNGILIGKYVGGQRASGWSAHGGDICGSCCVK